MHQMHHLYSLTVLEEFNVALILLGDFLRVAHESNDFFSFLIVRTFISSFWSFLPLKGFVSFFPCSLAASVLQALVLLVGRPVSNDLAMFVAA